MTWRRVVLDWLDSQGQEVRARYDEDDPFFQAVARTARFVCGLTSLGLTAAPARKRRCVPTGSRATQRGSRHRLESSLVKVDR